MPLASLNGWHLVILVGVLVLLFGAKKLPDMARSLGQSARILKGEIKGMKDQDSPTTQAPQQPAPSAQAPQQPPIVPSVPLPTQTGQPPIEQTAHPADLTR